MSIGLMFNGRTKRPTWTMTGVPVTEHDNNCQEKNHVLSRQTYSGYIKCNLFSWMFSKTCSCKSHIYNAATWLMKITKRPNRTWNRLLVSQIFYILTLKWSILIIFWMSQTFSKVFLRITNNLLLHMTNLIEGWKICTNNGHHEVVFTVNIFWNRFP